MKSLKDYSMNLPEREYHDYPAWSYSTIARYAKNGFSAIATLHDKIKPTPEMEFGSLFDSIITRGKETLNEYVIDDTSIAPAEKSVFDYLLSNGHKEPFAEISMSAIDEAVEACPTFASKYKKPDTRYTKLSESSKYYDVRRSGKKSVSGDDWHDAVQMANILTTAENTRNIFKKGTVNNVEYIYQPQFLVDWVIENEKVKLKVMHDLIIVDHNNKTIQPVDLKTSSNQAFSWSENFVKLRYDLQAELYTDVLRKICTEVATEYANYTILPYIFADISRSDMIPVTYVYDPSNGFSFSKGDRVYEYNGWKQNLAEILVYEANDAKVPNYISLTEPNDIIDLLSTR